MGRARAFAWRRSRLLSLVEHARRSDGSGAIADPGDHRSPRQEARRRRRPAGQELAPAASAGAPQWPRSQETGDGRLRRAAAAVGEGVARRNRRHADVLEFLRRPRKQGIHTRDRDGSRRESPRGEGAGSARRLHLRPRVGRAQRLDPGALPRRRPPSQGHSRLLASRMAAAGAAHPRHRLGRACDLPSALRRRHRAPVARRGGGGCAGLVSRARRDRRRGARRPGTRARGRHLLPAGCPGVNVGARLVSLALLIAAVTVREGARSLDHALDDMAQVFRMGAWTRMRHVILPQLAPYLAAAARSGLSLVWKIVLIVELLGRPNGVGFEIGVAFQLFDVTRILAYALAFIAVMLGIETFLVQPLERYVARWRPRPA